MVNTNGILNSSACPFLHVGPLSSFFLPIGDQAHLCGAGNVNVSVGIFDGRTLKMVCTSNHWIIICKHAVFF